MALDSPLPDNTKRKASYTFYQPVWLWAGSLEMHSNKAAELRSQWQANGNAECTHVSVETEHFENGAFTGKFVCVRCGAQLAVTQLASFSLLHRLRVNNSSHTSRN